MGGWFLPLVADVSSCTDSWDQEAGWYHELECLEHPLSLELRLVVILD